MPITLIRNILIVGLFISTLSCLETAALSADDIAWPGQWPNYRRDRYLTGFAPGRGRISKPETAWRYYLGQWSTQLAVRGAKAGRTSELAVDNEETTAPLPPEWTPPRETYDLLGDGGAYAIEVQGAEAWISSAAGEVVWRHTFPHPIEQHAVGRFDPEKSGRQVVFWGAKVRERVVFNGGYCFSFDGGFGDAQQLWEVEVDRNPQKPKLHAADMDGDGDDEAVIVTWYRAIVFDGATGEVRMECENAQHRNYGYTRVLNVDDDPYPEIVVLCDFVLHVDFIDNDGQKLWKPWEGQYPYSVARDEILRVPHEPVADVDGDGEWELVYNLFNIPADGHWRMIVRDVKTGRVEISQPDLYVHDLIDLDGDGRPELLCDRVPLRQRTEYSALEIGRIREGIYEKVYDVPRGQWMRHQRPLTGNSRTMATDSHLGVAQGDVDGDGRPEVLLSIDADHNLRAESLCAVGIGEAATFQTKWQIHPPEQAQFTVGRLDDVDGDGRAEALIELQHGPGRFVLESATATCVSRRREGNLYSFPIAANLDGRPGAEILVQNGRDEIIALAAPPVPGEAPRRLWTRPGRGEPALVGYPGTWRGPVVADLDNDGRPEILYQDQTERDLCRLVVADGAGDVRWTRTFDDVPYSQHESRLDRFHTGRFNDDDMRDVYVAFHNAGQSSGQSIVLDGKTGETLWHRRTVSELYPPEERTLFQGNNDRGCFPTKGTVIHDFDGDGFDDLLFLALDYICLIDGPTGMALKPTPFLHSVLNQSWCAYSSPVTIDADGDGVREVFASASFGTVGALTLDWQPLWMVPSSYQTNPLSAETAVADFDGDGRMETIVLEHSGDLVQYDVKSGMEEGRLAFGRQSIGDQAAADIDGDGLPEAIFCRGNQLIALRGGVAGAGPRILWIYELPAEGGPPIVADVNGDGILEIVICTADGYVNVVDQTAELN